jgi:hypothetical protein
MIIVQQYLFIDELGREITLNSLLNQEPFIIEVEFYYSEDSEDIPCELHKSKINDFLAWLEQTDTGYTHRSMFKEINDNGEYVDDINVSKVDYYSLYECLDNDILAKYLEDVI